MGLSIASQAAMASSGLRGSHVSARPAKHSAPSLVPLRAQAKARLCTISAGLNRRTNLPQYSARKLPSISSNTTFSPAVAPARTASKGCFAPASKLQGRSFLRGDTPTSKLLKKAVLNTYPSHITIARWRRGNTIVVAALATDATGMEPAEIQKILDEPLPTHPKLHRGQLENGMRYVILPNTQPPNRFEAHLEVHAGSVDEFEHEQGIAHIVEHVTFLGSRKREDLLGTGSRSNAYTDFHHTVFHIHSPSTNNVTGAPMLPNVLEALREIAFEPQFSSARIEKERRAVLSEGQMMNTIEYRVDCQLLTYLHQENKLGCRFPIGLEEVVNTVPHETLRKFWRRWYFPANVTLFVVGEMECSVEKTIELIEATFGAIPATLDLEDVDEAVACGQITPEEAEVRRNLPAGPPLSLRRRHPLRPPVTHRFGEDIPTTPAMPSIFRHELLQTFSLSLFCKLPVLPVQTLGDLRRAYMLRIVISALQFRISTRYVDADPPFIGIDLDHSDSGREGCNVSTLTITANPLEWKGAVEVALQEMKRLARFGITPGELDRYCAALIRDSEQLASQAGCVPSADNLDFIMENDALGHSVMDQEQGEKTLKKVADTVSLDDVNELAASLLAFVANYGDARLRPETLQGRPHGWKNLGPTFCTAIVACVPAKVVVTDEADNEVIQEFNLTSEEIADALCAEYNDLQPLKDVSTPHTLLPEHDLERLVQERVPTFVPVGPSGETRPGPDPATGVYQRRLSNGIRINYRVTGNEPSGAAMRMVFAGGRAMEAMTGKVGSVAVGTRALSESGTVGDWRRDEVENFCVTRLINCVLEADEEFICMDFHFAMGDGGLAAAMGLAHLIMEAPRWEDKALKRAKQLYIEHYRSMHKSLERATGFRILSASLNKEGRWLDPTPAEVRALTIEDVRNAVMAQMHTGNLEVIMVGDFVPEDFEELALKYLGTIRPVTHLPPPPVPANALARSSLGEPPLVFSHTVRTLEESERRLRFHLEDSDNRAIAYITGTAPNRWGVGASPSGPVQLMPNPQNNASTSGSWRGPGTPSLDSAVRRSHPLYAAVSLQILSEIINGRLFTTVRDSLNLTYDVSFEVSLFDRVQAGWYVISVTSTPENVDAALDACIRTLRGFRTQRVTSREIDRAKRTLITRHETDMKDDAYWIGMLTHMQCEYVPNKSLDCLRDLVDMYEGASADDIYEAYTCLGVDDESIYTVVGTAGNGGKGGVSADGLRSSGPVDMAGRGRGSTAWIPVSNNREEPLVEMDIDTVDMPSVDPDATPRVQLPQMDKSALEGAAQLLSRAMNAALNAAQKQKSAINE